MRERRGAARIPASQTEQAERERLKPVERVDDREPREGLEAAPLVMLPEARIGLDEETLERLRRSVPLRIDREGCWWHEGEPFTHRRLIELFNRGLCWRGGEAALQVGDRWCYIDADETPFLVLRVSAKNSMLTCLLNSQELRSLEEATLTLSAEGIIFAYWKGWGHARFSRNAQAQCSAWLEVGEGERFILTCGAHQWQLQTEGEDAED
ncbi:MAG: hypothetical protein VYD19_09170 [Myxococcota bacterium]|nr:hypothetical protein [Myxococcota bacterium]